MAPPAPSHWTTHPEYIELLNYVVERTKDAKSPMNIMPLAKEFKEKRGATQTATCFENRIYKLRTRIHTFEHIDTNTKVKLLFASSASVDANFLKKLKKDALVEIDKKKRITHYKANDGSLELKGDHSLSAKCKTAQLESKGSLRSLIIDYFETKGDADAVPKNEEQKVMGNLIEIITEKCVNVDKPLSIDQLAKECNSRLGISIPLSTIRTRVKGYCRDIQNLEFLDTHTKVQQLFGLSATVDSDCLKELRKDAIVEIDEKNRIIYYKAADGSLELRGDHSHSAKMKTAMIESKGTIRSMINSYFENKNNADAVSNNKSESEMWQLIEFITEKCQPVDSPLSINKLTKDFIQDFESSLLFETVRYRIRRYGREIQKMEFLDTLAKMKQLFCISASVDSDYLEKLRKDAFVEVDNLNRITKCSANDGSLTLHGDHSQSAKNKLSWIVRRKNKKRVKKHSNSGGRENEESDNENGYSEDDSNEYSSEEFGSEFESDDENYHLYEPEDSMEPSNKADDFDNESPVRTRSPTQISIDNNFDFDPPTARPCPQIIEAPSKSSSSTSHTSKTPKRKADASGGSSSSKRTKPPLEEPMNPGKMNADFSRDDPSGVELNPFHGFLGQKHCDSDGDENEESEKKNEHSEDDSDEYSSEEFDSEFDSDDENDPLNKPDHMDSSNKTDDFDNEIPVGNRSPNGMSTVANIDFDPPIERSCRSAGSEMREVDGEENDHNVIRNVGIKTRSGKLSKRRHLDSDFSNNQVLKSSSSGASMNTESKPAKQRKMKIDKDQPSNSSSQSRRSSISVKRYSRDSSFSTFPTESEENMENQDAPRTEENLCDYYGPRNQEMEDYNHNPREHNLPESSSIDNFLGEPEPSAAEEHNPSIEAQNTHNRADAVVPDPELVEGALTPQNNKNTSPPTNGKEVISQEVPIKVEQEEPMIAEHSTEDVKPETAHNPKIKFFEAMKALILFLDTPSLSNLQSKIHQKIQKMKGSKEVLQNNELIPALELLVARMTNHSVIDISNNVETVSLIQFFCYLKASILNSKMIGVEGLMNNISGLIEKSRNK
ncbi:unnamed protein product, partial [Caenorhabditis brenneri]